MIATVTMNPAVDYTVSVTTPLEAGAVNRTSDELITAGGKGVNLRYKPEAASTPGGGYKGNWQCYLLEGEKVTLLAVEGTFSLVKNLSGKVGWVKSSTLGDT